MHAVLTIKAKHREDCAKSKICSRNLGGVEECDGVMVRGGWMVMKSIHLKKSF